MVVAKLRSSSCRRISARLLKMASALRYTDSCLHGKDTSHFQHACKSLLTHTHVTFNMHASHFQHACKSLSTCTQVTFNMHASHFQHAHKSLSTRTQVTFNTHASHVQHAHKSLSTRTQVTFNTHASHFQHAHVTLTCTQVTINTQSCWQGKLDGASISLVTLLASFRNHFTPAFLPD